MGRAVLVTLAALAVFVCSTAALKFEGTFELSAYQVQVVVDQSGVVIHDDKEATYLSHNFKATGSSKITSTIEVLAVPMKKMGEVGVLDSDGNTLFCCTPEFLDPVTKHCEGETPLNHLIFSRGVPESKDTKSSETERRFDFEELKGSPLTNGFGYQNISIGYENEDGVVVKEASGQALYFPEGDDDLYTLILANCNPDDHTVEIEVAWKNPYGYLPGELYGTLVFYGCVFAGYLVVVSAWSGKYLWHRKQILPVQTYIVGFLVLSLFEVSFYLFSTVRYNDHGFPPFFGFGVSNLLNIIKRAIARVLVLSCSLGYGLIRSSLGTDGKKVVILGAFYFIFSAFAAMADNEVSRSVEEFVRVFVKLPLTIIDVIFFMLTFLGLSRTISQLKERNLPLKLELYTTFGKILMFTALAAFIILGVEATVVVRKTYQERWPYVWMITAASHTFYVVVTSALAFLFRPRDNNTRYQRVEEINDDIEMGNVDNAIGGVLQDAQYGVTGGASSTAVGGSAVSAAQINSQLRQEHTTVVGTPSQAGLSLADDNDDPFADGDGDDWESEMNTLSKDSDRLLANLRNKDD